MGKMTLLQGDCLELMKEIPDGRVDLTVTSPPYDNLRTYNGNASQWDYEKFQSIAKELYRVTVEGGVIVWIVADATIRGSETGSSFKQALWFKECGFNLHDTMIRVKDGGGAVGSNLCYTQNFEYMFVFSKGHPKTINLIRDKPNQSYGVDKSGVGRRKKDGEKKIERRKPSSEFSRRNNWWYIPPEKGGDHPATFPLRLAHDHIISWSNPGDTVLDCFMGSGTTGVACLTTGRDFIGMELDGEYFQFAKERLKS